MARTSEPEEGLESSPGPEERQNGEAPRGERRGAPADAPHEPAERTLWMGDVQPEWTDDVVLGFFGELGVKSISRPWDQRADRPAMYAFVAFETEEDAQRAADLDGRAIPGMGRHRRFRLNPRWLTRDENLQRRRRDGIPTGGPPFERVRGPRESFSPRDSSSRGPPPPASSSRGDGPPPPASSGDRGRPSYHHHHHHPRGGSSPRGDYRDYPPRDYPPRGGYPGSPGRSDRSYRSRSPSYRRRPPPPGGRGGLGLRDGYYERPGYAEKVREAAARGDGPPGPPPNGGPPPRWVRRSDHPGGRSRDQPGGYDDGDDDDLGRGPPGEPRSRSRSPIDDRRRRRDDRSDDDADEAYDGRPEPPRRGDDGPSPQVAAKRDGPPPPPPGGGPAPPPPSRAPDGGRAPPSKVDAETSFVRVTLDPGARAGELPPGVRVGRVLADFSRQRTTPSKGSAAEEGATTTTTTPPPIAAVVDGEFRSCRARVERHWRRVGPAGAGESRRVAARSAVFTVAVAAGVESPGVSVGAALALPGLSPGGVLVELADSDGHRLPVDEATARRYGAAAAQVVELDVPIDDDALLGTHATAGDAEPVLINPRAPGPWGRSRQVASAARGRPLRLARACLRLSDDDGDDGFHAYDALLVPGHPLVASTGALAGKGLALVAIPGSVSEEDDDDDDDSATKGYFLVRLRDDAALPDEDFAGEEEEDTPMAVAPPEGGGPAAAAAASSGDEAAASAPPASGDGADGGPKTTTMQDDEAAPSGGEDTSGVVRPPPPPPPLPAPPTAVTVAESQTPYGGTAHGVLAAELGYSPAYARGVLRAARATRSVADLNDALAADAAGAVAVFDARLDAEVHAAADAALAASRHHAPAKVGDAGPPTKKKKKKLVVLVAGPPGAGRDWVAAKLVVALRVRGAHTAVVAASSTTIGASSTDVVVQPVAGREFDDDAETADAVVFKVAVEAIPPLALDDLSVVDGPTLRMARALCDATKNDPDARLEAFLRADARDAAIDAAARARRADVLVNTAVPYALHALKTPLDAALRGLTGRGGKTQLLPRARQLGHVLESCAALPAYRVPSTSPLFDAVHGASTPMFPSLTLGGGTTGEATTG
mmetsp:Transcript_10791/g.43671  ORF Transcript_10791/g.43671 Transcript_10791/m.43671 type:complete len:1108 (-) Transcript_10791:260-3583(-)